MKDFAYAIYESTFLDDYKTRIAKHELCRQAKIYEKLNKKYQKHLDKILHIKAKLEMQQSILKSL